MSEIWIRRGRFKGCYTVSPGHDSPMCDDCKLELADGTYWLDTGARIGGSTIVFRIMDGKIGTVQPPEAATVDEQRTTLTFCTRTVRVRRGRFRGSFWTNLVATNDGKFGEIDMHRTRQRRLQAIVGVRFAIENGARLGDSVFYASIRGTRDSNARDADDCLEVTNQKAVRTRGNRMRFRTATVDVIAKDGESVELTGYGSVETGEYQVIRGLVVVAGAGAGAGSEFRFVPA